jgi:hypothetical protein
MTTAARIETYLKEFGPHAARVIAMRIRAPLNTVKTTLYELRKKGIVVSTGPKTARLYAHKGTLKTAPKTNGTSLKIELPTFEFSVAYDDVRNALRARLVELHEETDRVTAALDALKQ